MSTEPSQPPAGPELADVACSAAQLTGLITHMEAAAEWNERTAQVSLVLQPSTGMWLLSKIEAHAAKPMSRAELEAHIADYARLQQLCSEQSSALKRAKELLRLNESQPVQAP